MENCVEIVEKPTKSYKLIRNHRKSWKKSYEIFGNCVEIIEKHNKSCKIIRNYKNNNRKSKEIIGIIEII